MFRSGNRKTLMKYLMIFFLGIVSLAMVLTLAPLPGGGDTESSQSNVLASLNGGNITIQNLQQAISNQLRTAGNDPKAITHIAQSALDQMILRRALITQAHKMGLEVSNQELVAGLRQIPFLYQNGQFIGMAEYENLVQQETGMAVPQFEAQMRESILVRKLRQTVTDDVEITPAEVHEDFLRRNEKAKINYVVFEPSEFVNAVKVTPAAIETYFTANRLHYKIQEQRKVKYVLIPPDSVRSQVQVSEADLQRYYNQHLAEYRVPDRVKVAHILFKTTGDTPQQAAQEQATAEKVLEQIKAGANFAQLAKKYSQDTGSAVKGGELGWIERGQTVKAFEDAAFSMKPGQISNLIKTQYGYHIIKVEGRQVAHVETLDDVKDAIRQTLEKQKLAQAQQAVAAKFQQALKAKPDDFEAAAKQNGLQAAETPLFSYNQPVPDLGNNESFENLAFQLPLDGVGDPITVPKGVAVIQVTQIVPEHLPNLNEVKPRVEQDYRTEQSKLLTAEKARQFAAEVKQGDFQKIAKSDGYKAKTSQEFTGQDQVSDLIQGTSVASAFTLPPGKTSDAIAMGSNYVVFQVVSHTPANEADFASQKETLGTQLLQQKRDLAFEIYQQNLKQQLLHSGKLKINQKAFKQFLAGYQESS
ncbi:MAG TPA: peptidyl-prolyl cis-trans isomerase [Terriglobia bacterium]|nr:peptidyl-prolyl cis-trans isomerase [Terriglobia bacterium]